MTPWELHELSEVVYDFSTARQQSSYDRRVQVGGPAGGACLNGCEPKKRSLADKIRVAADGWANG